MHGQLNNVKFRVRTKLYNLWNKILEFVGATFRTMNVAVTRLVFRTNMAARLGVARWWSVIRPNCRDTNGGVSCCVVFCSCFWGLRYESLQVKMHKWCNAWGSQHIYGQVAHPFLWDGSRAAVWRIALNGITNRLNYWVLFVVCST